MSKKIRIENRILKVPAHFQSREVQHCQRNGFPCDAEDHILFTKPGTYFPTLRVTSQRHVDNKTPYARISNLGVRAVVE